MKASDGLRFGFGQYKSVPKRPEIIAGVGPTSNGTFFGHLHSARPRGGPLEAERGQKRSRNIRVWGLLSPLSQFELGVDGLK